MERVVVKHACISMRFVNENDILFRDAVMAPPAHRESIDEKEGLSDHGIASNVM
jgi:hypothetical protein